MNLVLAGRILAVVISLSTFVFLFLHDSWRADNLFLGPDLVLCVVLLAAAFVPAHRAPPALVLAFGIAVGVFMTSVSSYAVRGELGIASLIGLLACAVMAGLLLVKG